MERQIVDDQLKLTLQDKLVASRVEQLVEKAHKYLDSIDGVSTVVLDLKGVSDVDSRGVTFVVGLYKEAQLKNKRFKVVGANEDVYWLFNLMKLSEVFDVEKAG
ncbi:MAG: STAS domain-containing protein [Candidatus Saccharibacteria bacterium]